jgi:alpha-aminoadipic semialdehyde synthase
MMAVDILPASVPLDASHHFSNALEPYLAALIEEETAALMGGHNANNATSESYQTALTRATITSAGVLASKHMWLQPKVDQTHKTPALTATSDSNASSADVNNSSLPSSSHPEKERTSSFARRTKKKILMLGSGMVAQPAVDMIAVNEDVELVVGKFFSLSSRPWFSVRES